MGGISFLAISIMGRYKVSMIPSGRLVRIDYEGRTVLAVSPCISREDFEHQLQSVKW